MRIGTFARKEKYVVIREFDRISSTVLGNVIFQILSIYFGTLLYNKNVKLLKNLI